MVAEQGGGEMTRIVLMTLALAPYLYYGGKDQVFHFVGRKVSLVEHILHVFIGALLAAAIASAYRARMIAFVLGIAAFLVFGALDEYVYHRGLPEHESDLHAKGHLALLIFVVVSLSTIWLERNGWRLGSLSIH
jgi:hypothetical protein